MTIKQTIGLSMITIGMGAIMALAAVSFASASNDKKHYPRVTPTPTVSCTPTPSATPTPTVTNTPTPTVSVSATPTVTPTPTTVTPQQISNKETPLLPPATGRAN